MKVTYVDLSPSRGGSIISLERLLSRLDRSSFQPTVVLAERNPGLPRFRAMDIPTFGVPTFVANVEDNTRVLQRVKANVLRPERRSRGALGFAWICGRTARNLIIRDLPLISRLYGIFRATRPDLVHINDAIFASRPAVAACWLAVVPALCHVRSLSRWEYWDRLWAHTMRGFLFVSQWVAFDWQTQAPAGPLPIGQSAGGERPKCRVAYDGLDPAPFDRVSDRAAARDRLGFPADRPIVVVLGRLVPWKGQDLFLRAMRQVVDIVPNALGLVVGPPERYCADYEPSLHTLAAELGLTDSVRFIDYLEDTPTLLAGIDLLAHTSVSPEPFGLVMLEAMAARRPVVTPAEGGGLEIVVDGVTGLLYEPRNPAALSGAIIQVLRDPAGAALMGEAGRARVAERFNLDQFAANVGQFYEEL
jgi:glycosyltransferase involved in cell wall biosynthesis